MHTVNPIERGDTRLRSVGVGPCVDQSVAAAANKIRQTAAEQLPPARWSPVKEMSHGEMVG